MTGARVFFARLRGLFGRTRRARELDDEIGFHIEMQTERNMAAGMGRSEARQEALRAFGSVDPIKESYRDRQAFAAVERLAQDLRYAVRTLRRSPAYTVTAVAVLALAIGTNTAMFSVLNAVVLRPLPFPLPDQLVMIWSEDPAQNVREGRSSFQSVEEWRRESRSFSDLAVFDPVSVTLSSGGEAEHVSVGRISPGFFPLLGVQPLLGRNFTAEDAVQRRRVVLISQRFWRSHFGRTPEAIGTTVELDGLPSRVIGVLPEYSHLSILDADVWEPHSLFPDWETRRGLRGADTWFVIGRLRAGISVESAQSEMNILARSLNSDRSLSERNRGVSVVPLGRQVAPARARLALWMLAGAVFLVLLIAAANVAALSVARSAGRERELSIRSALGAGRSRIVRQLLAESLVLATISGVVGVLLAVACVRVIQVLRPGDLARLDEVSVDPVVVGCAVALCLFTALAVGLAPALTVARPGVRSSALSGGRGDTSGVATRGIRRLLVVLEFALAVVLTAGAGLLIRSLWSVLSVDPGYRPERVLSLQLSVPPTIPGSQRADFCNRVIGEIRALPGVENAAVIGNFFIGGNPERTVTAEADGRAFADRFRFRSDEVSEGFFQAAGTPLLKGRYFSTTDGRGLPQVAIINDAMARRLWPGSDPVGKRLKLDGGDSDRSWFTVVGVVGDMRRQGLEYEPIPQMFEPLAQNPSRLTTLLVRTSAEDPLGMAGAVRDAVRRVEKLTPTYRVTTLEALLGGFAAQRRFQTTLLTGFAAMALLMAAIGVYGLLEYSVATRRREISIRMAVGAQEGEILRMTIGESLRLSVAGLGLGLAGAFLLSRAGKSLLFGVTAADPLTFVAVSLLLLLVAVTASYFPARRATKVDPLIALRQE